MNLSKRERIIVTAAVITVGLLIADRLVLGPLLAYRAELEEQKQHLVTDLQQARRVFDKSRRMRQRWRSTATGGLQATASAAESRVLHAVRQWSRDSGLSLVATKPETRTDDPLLTTVEVQVTGNGTMAAAARFLFEAETSELPLRVTETRLGSRQRATDDLTLDLRLSMLYVDTTAQQDASLAREDRP